jgi:hypothetical protein
MLVLAGPRHHPLLFADPSSPPLPKDTSGLSTDILSQPHASSLSPPLVDDEPLARSRRLAWLDQNDPRAILARVSGLPRFDRIATAVSPRRDVSPWTACGADARPKAVAGATQTHRLHGDTHRCKTLSSWGTTDASRSSCSVRPVFPDDYGLQRGQGPCFPPASARHRRSYLPSRDSPRRERKIETGLFKSKAGFATCR